MNFVSKIIAGDKPAIKNDEIKLIKTEKSLKMGGNFLNQWFRIHPLS